MKHKHIYDPAFKYVRAHETDLKKTFARVRREQKEAEELAKKVVPIKQVK